MASGAATGDRAAGDPDVPDGGTGNAPQSATATGIVGTITVDRDEARDVARDEPRDSRYRMDRPSVVIDADDPASVADPAASVVPIGQVPSVQPPAPIRGRLFPPMPTDLARGWIVTAVLTLIGGLTRFWQLGWRSDGGTPLFDEKYYAVQAAEMIRTGGVDDNQAFGVIVHPPLGKQLIAIPEMIFGYNPIGWRFASAVCGTLCILLIIRATRRLTRSTLLGGIAGVLLICDGVSQVMSHTALMDSIMAPFVLGAFACLLVDRDQVRSRLALAVSDGSMTMFSSGVPLGARWWRFGCGFLLGCATAIKWNGAYWIIAFGIMSVIWDITARKRYGVRHPVTAVVRRDFVPSLWSLGIVPVLTYIASYWAWFTNETGWDRHVSAGGNGIGGALRSLVTMTLAMLKTTSGILTPTDPASRHPWESKPWSWPLSTRPLLTYLSSGTTGCGDGRDDCVKRILIVGTPLLWWVSLFVLGWALWKAFGRLDWRYAAVLVGYGAGYLPWFIIFDRQMYFFYMMPIAPFLVIGITLVLGDVLGRASPRASPRASSRVPVRAPVALSPAVGTRAAQEPPNDTEPIEGGRQPQTPSYVEGSYVEESYMEDEATPTRAPRTGLWSRLRASDPRTVRLMLVSAYIGLVVANFIWMWPILMGDPITPQRLMWETWLPSWG